MDLQNCTKRGKEDLDGTKWAEDVWVALGSGNDGDGSPDTTLPLSFLVAEIEEVKCTKVPMWARGMRWEVTGEGGSFAVLGLAWPSPFREDCGLNQEAYSFFWPGHGLIHSCQLCRTAPWRAGARSRMPRQKPSEDCALRLHSHMAARTRSCSAWMSQQDEAGLCPVTGNMERSPADSQRAAGTLTPTGRSSSVLLTMGNSHPHTHSVEPPGGQKMWGWSC